MAAHCTPDGALDAVAHNVTSRLLQRVPGSRVEQLLIRVHHGDRAREVLDLLHAHAPTATQRDGYAALQRRLDRDGGAIVTAMCRELVGASA